MPDDPSWWLAHYLAVGAFVAVAVSLIPRFLFDLDRLPVIPGFRDTRQWGWFLVVVLLMWPLMLSIMVYAYLDSEGDDA